MSDRAGFAERVIEAVEATLVGHPLAIEQATDQADRLVQSIKALAETGPEVHPERVVFALEPATADAEDRPAARDVVERRDELRGESRVAERVGRNHQAEIGACREGRERRQRCPALELGARPVALV